MRNQLRMTWRAGAATVALAATLLVGTLPASAQMHTETIGAPGSGAVQVGGGYGESGLATVYEDHGGPSLRREGGYGVPVGPECTFEVGGSGGPGYNEVFNGEACGIGGGYVEHRGDGRIESHYP